MAAFLLSAILLASQCSLVFAPRIASASTTIIIAPGDPVVTEKGTINFTANIPVTWSLAPGSAGSINSATGVYQAPATITANNVVGGCQSIPNDDIFSTPVANLPVDQTSTALLNGPIPSYPVQYQPSWGTNFITNATPSYTMSFYYNTELDGDQFQIPIFPNVTQQAGVQESGDYLPLSDGANDRHISSVNIGNCQSTDIYNRQSATYSSSGWLYNGDDLKLPNSLLGSSGTMEMDPHFNGTTDAGGMELQPLAIHLSEIEAGAIKHAVRFTLSNSWIAPRYIWPATDNAGAFSPQLLPYGTRLRLKSSYNISSFSPVAQVLLTELKQYGMVLSDGGTSFGVQTDADVDEDQAVTSAIHEIFYSGLNSTDFEVVDESSLENSSLSGSVNLNNGYVTPQGYATVIATDNSNSANTASLAISMDGVGVGTYNPAIDIAGGASVQIPAWVTAANNTAVTYNMSPTLGSLTQSGLYTAPNLSNPASTTITIASVENPNAKTVVKIFVIPDPSGAIRMKTPPIPPLDYSPPLVPGGYGPDSQGNDWWFDPGSVRGGDYPDDDSYGTAFPTTDTWLYNTEDSSYGDYIHNLIVPNGNYNLTLTFAPAASTNFGTTWCTAGSQDIFLIDAQGQTLNPSFDLAAATNCLAGQPYTLTYPVTVTNGDLYFGLFKLLDNNGNLDAVTLANFTVIPTSGGSGGTTPPSVPAGLAANAVSSSQINLSWSASSGGSGGISGYAIYRGGTQIATTTTTSYFDKNLSPSTAYTYTVASYDTAGNKSSQSGSVSATTQAVAIAPPTVSITAPSNNASLSGTVTVSAAATPSSGTSISSVQLLVDGSAVGTDSASPFTFSVNTNNLSNGVHTFSAIAKDAAGNQTTSQSVTVTVSNTVVVTSPSVPTGLTATAISSSQINLSWTASTAAGIAGVAGYAIYRGGAQIATTTMTSYSDKNLSPSTSYSYTVASYDTAGNKSAQSGSVSATTQAAVDITPPTISITAPSANSSVNGVITVNANAADNVAVASVQFLVDGSVAATVINPPYTFSLNTNTLSNGTHILSAIAKDTSNNQATAQNITITVANSVVVTSNGGGGGGGSGGGGASPVANVQAPQAFVTRPQNNATVATTTLVTAAVSDQSAIVSVQLVVDGASGAVVTQPPYIFYLNTSLLSNGIHHIGVIAKDSIGDTAVSPSISVTVNNLGGTSIAFPTSLPSSSSTATSAGSSASSGNTAPLLTIQLDAGVNAPAQVLILQSFLLARGYLSSTKAAFTPGVFDATTKIALEAFQCKAGIACASTLGYGRVGPVTMAAINNLLSGATFSRTLFLGSTGADVKVLQKVLQNLGYFPSTITSLTTYFGSVTKHALMLFQGAHLLPVTGILDAATRTLLNKVVAANPQLSG